MLHEDNAAVELGGETHSEAANHINQAHPQSGVRELGLLSRIAESPAIRNAVFALSTILGGAGIASITGCSPDNSSFNNQVGVVRMLEREAKFSTLGTDAKVTLQEMPELLKQREALGKAIDAAIPHAREVVTNFEADNIVPKAGLETLKGSLADLEKQLVSSAANESFAAVKTKLTELATQARDVQLLTESDFTQGTQSPGYLKTQAVMQSLYDWSTAVERDVVNFKSGVHALKVATLVDAVQKTEAALQTVEKEESISKWVSLHAQDARTIGESIASAITNIGKSSSDPAFSPVGEDLGDLKTLLMDLSKVFPTPTAEAYPSSADSKSEKALVKEALALSKALRADLQKELTHTLGVQAPAVAQQQPAATGAQQQNQTAPQGTQVVHHHHGSSNNLLLYYMLFNNNRGYNSGYTYVPNHTPSYSGVSRLRTSPEYSSFSKTSEDNHTTLRGHGGFASHASGPLGRSSPAAPSVSSGGGFKSSSGISSPSHSSGSSHVGGFNAGRSSSAGFGG